MRMHSTSQFFFLLALSLFVLNGCMTTGATMPKAAELQAPDALMDNSGAYMCPYTQDEVVAPWCDKAINASMGATIGSVAGGYVGSKVLGNVPFVGGFLGQEAGKAIGRSAAIEASGGFEYIKESSDISFTSIDDMVVWLYVTKSSDEHYADVIKAVSNIYPEFNDRYMAAIANAKQKDSSTADRPM